MKQVLELLYENQDVAYADFQQKLIPTKGREFFIGVRTPALRKLAKQVMKEDYCKAFLSELPHEFYDEDQLHGFIISEMKDFDECMDALEKFIPFMDNWATVDQTSPKIFKKDENAKRLLPYIDKWITSGKTYTVRFGIGMLMEHFLDERFDIKYAKQVAAVRSEEYYVRMEQAWYMATALAKQWDEIIPLIENPCMEKWTHNKTIQKARESYRITPEQKEYLKSLKL